MPHAVAVLVFDPSDAETTGEYDVYSIAPSDQGRLWGEWDAIRAGLTPTGRIPVTDVRVRREHRLQGSDARHRALRDDLLNRAVSPPWFLGNS